jgi:hypothetical protein
MYYALTTLSTVGFGDIYPVTNAERLICGFFMISGASIFSYVLTQLEQVVSQLNGLSNDIDEKDQLDKFFGVIK